MCTNDFQKDGFINRAFKNNEFSSQMIFSSYRTLIYSTIICNYSLCTFKFRPQIKFYVLFWNNGNCKKVYQIIIEIIKQMRELLNREADIFHLDTRTMCHRNSTVCWSRYYTNRLLCFVSLPGILKHHIQI